MSRAVHRRVQTAHRVVQDTLVIDLRTVHRVLSSAPRGGGLVRARSILNHQVAPNPITQQPLESGKRVRHIRWRDPARYLGMLAASFGARPPWVGLMTAVPMKRCLSLREESNGIWVECFCTVGVTNAVRAGEPAFFTGSARRCSTAGTINIILVTNATLSVPAMVGAVQVATESKTAALMDRQVQSRTGSGRATGTGTDAVVIACRMRGGLRLRYSGTHTLIGAMIGRLVDCCVRKGLRWAQDWERSTVRTKVCT